MVTLNLEPTAGIACWIFILLFTFCLWGTVLKKNRNRKCTKENDRKCLEIMQESLLFPCWNSQKGKINRCHLYYLKNGLSLSLFFPPFLAIVGTFLEDGSQFLGPCHLSGFEPWHLQYWCSALTNWASKPTGSWSLNWFVITVKFRK